MTNILTIYHDYNHIITGGQVYDHNLIEKIRSRDDVKMDFLLDDMLCTKSKGLINFAYTPFLKGISKYDYIITNSRSYTKIFLFIMLVRMITNCKVITIHHHFNFEIENGIRKLVHRFLELSFLKMVDYTIIPSPYINDLYPSLLPNKKSYYAELSTQDDIHNIQNKKNKIEEKMIILYVGTIEYRKGLTYLIDALHILKDTYKKNFKCFIVGKSEEECYKTNLKGKIREFNLVNEVEFTGRVTEEEKNDYYKMANCFVFPSLHEGYGMVLLEALSYGLPLVVFNNSAMPYTANEKNGIIVENKNALRMAEALNTLIEDNEYRQSLSDGAITYIKSKRTIKDMNNDFDAFADKLIKKEI